MDVEKMVNDEMKEFDRLLDEVKPVALKRKPKPDVSEAEEEGSVLRRHDAIYGAYCNALGLVNYDCCLLVLDELLTSNQQVLLEPIHRLVSTDMAIKVYGIIYRPGRYKEKENSYAELLNICSRETNAGPAAKACSHKHTTRYKTKTTRDEATLVHIHVHCRACDVHWNYWHLE